jgi:endonuclease III
VKLSSSGQTSSNRRQLAAEIVAVFEQAYSDAKCALEYGNPLELLIATILSAQCTDERVNSVTRNLFSIYRSAADYAAASIEALERAVRPAGFFRNKARSIQGACRILVERFNSQVPDTMEELLGLPGVARKTANVVLGVAYGKAEGVVVDTHVFRISRRLGLSSLDTPERVERDLMVFIPRECWIAFSHQAIMHGRRVCRAQRPMCPNCPVASLCQSPDKVVVLDEPDPKRGKSK